jgi:hypothetical protein
MISSSICPSGREGRATAHVVPFGHSHVLADAGGRRGPLGLSGAGPSVGEGVVVVISCVLASLMTPGLFFTCTPEHK